MCVYCGESVETRDHVPSKVLLDAPYPDNLPVVPACESCNASFSKDEEYLACLVECINVGDVNVDAMRRPKIKRILSEKPFLAARLQNARQVYDGNVYLDIEWNRLDNVILKLARGHALFEQNEPQFDAPSEINIFILSDLDENSLNHFENVSMQSKFPEVGARAMMRHINIDIGSAGWISVQPGQYRYLVSLEYGMTVRLVIGECLGAMVSWDLLRL